LLGIAERRGRFEVAGLLEVEQQQHDLAAGLRDMLNVPISAHIGRTASHGGEERVVLSVYVPEALRYHETHLRSQGRLDKGCYRRVGGEDMPCTEDDLARFFQDRALISPDMTPAPVSPPRRP
jgi:hypothetical protein